MIIYKKVFTDSITGGKSTDSLFKRIKDMYTHIYFTPQQTQNIIHLLNGMVYNYNHDRLNITNVNEAINTPIDKGIEANDYHDFFEPYLVDILPPKLVKIIPEHIFCSAPNNKLVLTYNDVKKLGNVHKITVEYYIKLPLTEVKIPGTVPFYRNSYVKIINDSIGKKIHGETKYTADGLRYKTVNQESHFIVFDRIFKARNI